MALSIQTLTNEPNKAVIRLNHRGYEISISNISEPASIIILNHAGDPVEGFSGRHVSAYNLAKAVEFIDQLVETRLNKFKTLAFGGQLPTIRFNSQVDRSGLTTNP